jgi:hypothetical protein
MISDLTEEEQAHVRAALHFLHIRCGTWALLGKALRCAGVSVRMIAHGRGVNASIAFRVARLARVNVEDVLAGRFPAAGTCPRCGHTKADDVK